MGIGDDLRFSDSSNNPDNNNNNTVSSNNDNLKTSLFNQHQLNLLAQGNEGLFNNGHLLTHNPFYLSGFSNQTNTDTITNSVSPSSSSLSSTSTSTSPVNISASN